MAHGLHHCFRRETLAKLPAHVERERGFQSDDFKLNCVDLLLRPFEVLSSIANPAILLVGPDALRVLLEHRHVVVGCLM